MRISTSIAPIWRALGLSEAEILTALKECGFDYLCTEFECGKPHNTEELSALYKDCGMSPVKARAISENPFAEADEIADIIRACGRMNIKKLVIPLGTAPDNTRKEYFSNNRAYLERLLPIAGENGVALMVEHAGNYQNLHHTHTGMELQSFAEFMEGRVKVNVNIANAGMADITMYPDIRVLGENVLSVDCSDNFFAMPLGVSKGREDLGLAPLMGFLDFDEVFIALKEIGYDMEFNLRMNSPRVFDKTSPYVKEPRLAVMPLPLVKRHYQWAYSVTRHMLKTYEAEDKA